MNLPFSLAEPIALLLLLAVPLVVYLGVLGVKARPRDRGRIITSVVLRTALLLLLTLAIGGLQWISNGGPLNVVFLIDESGSMPAETRQAAHDYVQRALAAMGPEDRAGVVRFGENALVDRAISGSAAWQPAPGVPGALATNIEDALQSGLALFPEGGSRRLVLLSDGLQSTGDARSLVSEAQATGVELSVVPLGGSAENELAVEGISSPSYVPAGQQFEAQVLLNSTSSRSVTVKLFNDNELVGEQQAEIGAGKSVVQFNLQAEAEGFRELRAEVTSVDDAQSENNTAFAFTIVSSPPSVLIVAGAPEDSQPLQRALEASQIKVTAIEPQALPSRLEALSVYDTIVLANVSTDAIGLERQQVLQAFVRDLGHGLVMLGGELSFGAGGYLRSPLEEVLPVSMDVRASEQRASIALTYLIDKSGSMGRCHAVPGQTFEPTMRTEFGPSKIEISKQAISRASALLNSSDQVGVVGFDAEAQELINVKPMGEIGPTGIELELSGVTAQGGPSNMFAGLQAAIRQMQGADAGLKHIIVMSDGWIQQADFSSLIAEIQASGITLSTVGVGEGPGDLLKELAEKGGGQYYAAANVYSLPDVLLKETVRLAGQYYIEEELQPVAGKESPILRELDVGSLPPLLGYNAATLKPTADGILLSPKGDPILAQWQYGLGKTVAWTPDMKGRWATRWVEWPQFAQFTGQMIQWTAPSPGSSGIASTYQLTPSGRGGMQDLKVTVESRDAQGAPRNALSTTVILTGSVGSPIALSLEQESPGVYSGVARGLKQGVYRTHIEQRGGVADRDLVVQDEGGVVIPYSSEFAVVEDRERVGREFMSDMAQLGGGRVLAADDVGPVWAHNLPSQPMRVPLWPYLLLGAILLFPLDVAVRRLSLSWKDLRLRRPPEPDPKRST